MRRMILLRKWIEQRRQKNAGRPGAESSTAISPRFLDLQLFAGEEDKTEKPTPHRLREARKRGQVMKSMEANSAINLLGMLFFFIIFWRYFLNLFQTLFTHYLRQIPGTVIDDISTRSLFHFSMEQFAGLTAPILAVSLLLGFVSNILQVGFLVSSEALKPQLSRISPVEGFKRIFSRRALFELVKSLLKVSIIGAVCYIYLKDQFEPLLLLLGEEASAVTAAFVQVLQGLGLRVAAVFFLLAALDFIYQRMEYLRNLKMSRKEIKDEYKQLEGDPLVRSRLREKQREMARARSLADVPDSTVVVTNPTELAVALRYRQGEDEAPVVVAKGAGRLARRIREIAREHDIPIIQNPPVAQRLYKDVSIGAAIPIELYQAVAEILAMVYRLQEKVKGKRTRI
ncbi:MAG: flagellar biosynthesis protein FlhB [Firmicutes bacterium]|nr:flagellar biosynthesis protein FlhB [Bacillota bacterium]